MDFEEWIETVRGICKSQGEKLYDEEEIVLRSKIALPESAEAYEALYARQAAGAPPHASLQFYTSMVKGGMIGLVPLASKVQREVFNRVGEAIMREFFRRLCLESAFGSVENLPDEQRALIEQYSGSHREFANLLRVYDTYATEVNDLFPEFSDTVLAQVLSEIRQFIKGLFFPAEGPYRVDIKTRIASQEQVLKRYAPTFDRDAYFTRNPVLTSLKRGEASWPGYVLTAVFLVGALLVPQDALWGKVLFGVLMGVVAVCVGSIIVRSLLSRKRLI